MGGRIAKPWRRKGVAGAWYAWISGRRVRVADPEATDREAQVALRALLGLVDRGESPVEVVPPTVAEVALEYLAHLEGRVRSGTLSARTHKTHKQRLDALERELGERVAATLKPVEVEAWVAGRSAWGPTMRAQVLASVRSAWRWARGSGLLAVNPLEGLRVPQPGRRERVLTPADAAKAIEAARNPELRLLLRVLHGTGCRPSEAVAVTAADLDLAAGVWVRAGKTTRKTGRARVVRIPADLLPELAAQAQRHPVGPLLRNTAGQPWTEAGLHSAFLRLRKITGLGLELSPYAFRHLFVTDALVAGVPLASVAELAGHASTQMVSRVYSHLGREHDHLREQLATVRGTPADPAPEPQPAKRKKPGVRWAKPPKAGRKGERE